MSRRAIMLCLILLAMALAAQATSAHDCGESGQVSRQTYLSNVAGAQRYYSIYLPPCYTDASDAYPLLMLLHGSNADDSQWLRLGFVDALEEKLQQGVAPPMIIVLPFGDAIANLNHFGADSYAMLLLELLDLVDQRYRTDGRRAIGGFSRGGFWAYHLGLRFPETFAAIGGHSPFFDVGHAAPAHNPLDLATALPTGTGLRLWLDRGTRDFAADGVDRMHLLLGRAGIDHEYRVYAGGGHDEASWRQNVDDYLDFYIAALEEPGPAKEEHLASSPAIELWLPVGSFAALRASITREELDAILAGNLNRQVVLSETAAARLRQAGVEIHPATRTVSAEQLERLLWRDKSSFTLLPFADLTLALRPLMLDGLPVVDQLDDYPLAWTSDTPNYAADRLTRITVSGTTALARGTLPALEAMGIEAAASGIRGYVSAADFST